MHAAAIDWTFRAKAGTLWSKDKPLQGHTQRTSGEMRLICPNCDAQYEIPIDVIPKGGRDVQCSNCGHTWFEQHPDDVETTLSLKAQDRLDEDPDDDFDDAPIEPAAAPAPKPRELDPQIADVLREEAALESQARAADVLESQPELGLSGHAPDIEAQSDPRRSARLYEAPPEDDVDAAAETQIAAAAAAAATTTRGGLLPDVEEINSTLRNGSEPRKPSGGSAHTGKARKTSAFGRGFRWALSLAIFAVVLYLFAPQIGTAVPETDGLLKSYVEAVNAGRVWLADHVAQGLLWLDGMSSEAAQSAQE